MTQIQVNLDYLRTLHLHIAMPCYGGMLTESAFMSFIEWANTANELGIKWTIETLTNESLINRARNTMTANFLANPERTHLVFIDADIGWKPWHLLAIIDRNVDVIGGLYPMKTLPIKWCVNGIENGHDSGDGLVEVSKIGTGFMAIKREVFFKLNSHQSVHSYQNDIGMNPDLDQHMKTYFGTDVRGGRLLSEDWQFCDNFRQLGGKVYVDTRVRLKHTGSFTFSDDAQQKLIESFGTMLTPSLHAE